MNFKLVSYPLLYIFRGLKSMTLFLNFPSLTQQKGILYLSQQHTKISKSEKRKSSPVTDGWEENT